MNKRKDYNKRWGTDKYNPLPRPLYKRKVKSREYKGYTVDIDDIAKYPGDFTIDYKYNITNGKGGPQPEMIIKLKPYNRGDSIGDNRIQHTYRDFKETIFRHLLNLNKPQGLNE